MFFREKPSTISDTISCLHYGKLQTSLFEKLALPRQPKIPDEQIVTKNNVSTPSVSTNFSNGRK